MFVDWIPNLTKPNKLTTTSAAITKPPAFLGTEKIPYNIRWMYAFCVITGLAKVRNGQARRKGTRQRQMRFKRQSSANEPWVGGNAKR